MDDKIILCVVLQCISNTGVIKDARTQMAHFICPVLVCLTVLLLTVGGNIHLFGNEAPLQFIISFHISFFEARQESAFASASDLSRSAEIAPWLRRFMRSAAVYTFPKPVVITFTGCRMVCCTV